MSNYTRDEIDGLVRGLNGRITWCNQTLGTANSNITAHINSVNAHNNILSLKANQSRVDELEEMINSFNSRLSRYEDGIPFRIDGTNLYTKTGSVGYDYVDIKFDASSLDGQVVYELIGGELLEGLTFDSIAGTIKGYPTQSGTSNLVILAKYQNHALIITTTIIFTDYRDPLNTLVENLRSGNLDNIELGTVYTILFPSVDYNSAYLASDSSYNFFADDDETVLFNLRATTTQLVNGSYPFYWNCRIDNEYFHGVTDDLLLVAGTQVKDESGNVIYTFKRPAPYLKEYRLILTSIDTDIDRVSGYNHTARLEFLDVLSKQSTKYSSGSRQWLNKGDFILRIPQWLKNMAKSNFFMPSLYSLTGSNEYYMSSLNQTITFSSPGPQSSYYTDTVDYQNPKFIRYLRGTNTPFPTMLSDYLSGHGETPIVESNGSISIMQTINASERTVGLAPAFVIA